MNLFEYKKQYAYLFVFFSLVASINLFFLYQDFQEFRSLKIYKFEAKVINIYYKNDYNVLKLSDDNMEFFTSISLGFEVKKLDYIKGYVLTNKITFLNYLKGFYANSFGLYVVQKQKLKKQELLETIYMQHENSMLQSLFAALFLAVPLDQEVREICAILGVSHLIALSGFHLGLLSGIFYFLLYYPYSFVHQKYFPYRNKKIDLLVFVLIVLFGYLYFTDFVPSLLRAFVMYAFGVYFLQANIKLLSYETLFLVVLIILALFPKMIFSLSFWFSVIGVFYIFLFLQYFKTLPKVFQFILFNLWIYLAVNAIVHYFFDVTALVQLFSPILTILFSVFYPLELLMHIVGQGGLLDSLILPLFTTQYQSYAFSTPLWFFIVYIIVSLGATREKYIFYLFNILLVGFNMYLFLLI